MHDKMKVLYKDNYSTSEEEEQENPLVYHYKRKDNTFQVSFELKLMNI